MFWKGINVDKNKLTIDGDSILAIYLYIIINSDIPNLWAQIQFMQTYTTPYVQNVTKLGYCLDTLSIALNHLMEMNSISLMKIKAPNEFDRDEIIEERRSLTKTYRESIKSKRQEGSLIIQDDPFDRYQRFDSLSKI